MGESTYPATHYEPPPHHGTPATDRLVEAVAIYSQHLAEKMDRGGQSEDQLRAPIEQLFRDLGNALGIRVIPYGEVRMPEYGVRPDYAIDIDNDRIGYIELKAPSTGVPPNWKKQADRNRRQYERMCDLPNLLYTDGIEWKLIRPGEAPTNTITLSGDIKRGTLRPPENGAFHDLVNKFLGWTPKSPSTLSRLIKVVAGPCRMLRAGVSEILEIEDRSPGVKVFKNLAADWRKLLFPMLADEDFPDAYAQTVTFALLLARDAGISFDGNDLREIAGQLMKQHPLMGRALHVLTHGEAVRQLKILDTLRVVIGAIDWQALPEVDRERYWDLYEPFLKTYDKGLRQRSGSYYTPEPVARFMADFTDKVVSDKLGRIDGLAADDVYMIDPAMGTGTFLLAIMQVVAQKCERMENTNYARAVLRELYRNRLIGFERSAAPYVVAELRINQLLKDVYNTELPKKSMRFLANTLADPTAARQEGMEYAEIIESRLRQIMSSRLCQYSP